MAVGARAKIARLALLDVELDFTLPASIKCLYRTARLPKNVPKIDVSNACIRI